MLGRHCAQLTRQNVATEDPDHPFFFITTGEQRSRGVEVEGTWRPAPAWQFSLAYTYIEAEVTKDTSLPKGRRLPNVPHHNVYLYGKYVVPEGMFKNLGFSLSWLYNSAKSGGLARSFRLPGYNLFDAGLSYAFGSWKAQLNVNNLFDKRFFPDACCLDRVTPGEPRNWRLTLNRTF